MSSKDSLEYMNLVLDNLVEVMVLVIVVVVIVIQPQFVGKWVLQGDRAWFIVMLGIKPRALYMLHKHCIPWSW